MSEPAEGAERLAVVDDIAHQRGGSPRLELVRVAPERPPVMSAVMESSFF